MLRFRAFRNTDPPRVAEIWRSRARDPHLLQPISVDLLEQLIFGKLHFDYAGMILAMEEDRPVGFAHASFGPDAKRHRISTETGVTCVIVVRPDCDQHAVAEELLDRCEAYLRGQGAKVLYGGGFGPVSPFYLGLYGGCELPGVLASDEVSRRLFAAHGYAEVDRALRFRQDLGAFRGPQDRRQMQCRRRLLVQVIMDPPARDRWEACTAGDFDGTRFELVPRGGGAPLAYALVRAMEWGSPARSGRTAGLVDLFVDPEWRRQGLATHLICESFRILAGQGTTLAEAQALQTDLPMVGLYQKLGFEQYGEGIVFRKPL